MATDVKDICLTHGVKHRAHSKAARDCAAAAEAEAATGGPRLEQLPLVEIHADDLHFVLSTRGRLDRVGSGVTPVSLPGTSAATLVDWREVADMLTWCPDLTAAAQRLTAWANEPVLVA